MSELPVGPVLAGADQEAVGPLVPEIPHEVATTAPAKALTRPPFLTPPPISVAIRVVTRDLQTPGATEAVKVAPTAREGRVGPPHGPIPRVPPIYVGRPLGAAAPRAGRRRTRPTQPPPETERRGRARLVPGQGPRIAST